MEHGTQVEERREGRVRAHLGALQQQRGQRAQRARQLPPLHLLRQQLDLRPRMVRA